MLCLIVFGCQYQCNWLPGETRLPNDVLRVEWDVKPYTLTHSLNVQYFQLLTRGFWRYHRSVVDHISWSHHSPDSEVKFVVESILLEVESIVVNHWNGWLDRLTPVFLSEFWLIVLACFHLPDILFLVTHCLATRAARWLWWDSSLIFDDQLVSFSALTLLVGHLACKNCPRNDL